MANVAHTRILTTMKILAFLFFSYCIFLLNLPVAWGQSNFITCQSLADRYRHCFARTRRAQVEVYRELGSVPCERDKTWGVDERGIWVDGGCRARFKLSFRRPDPLRLEPKERKPSQKVTPSTRDRGDMFQRQCPEGYRFGGCSAEEVRQGCQQIKADDGTPCKSNPR